MDSNRIRMLHDLIDKQVAAQEPTLLGTANRIMFRRVHSGMLHAIIEMAVEHEMDSEEIEEAIGSAIANMVNSYVTGVVHQLDIQTARETASAIMLDAVDCVVQLVDKTFVREANDNDSIQ